jgi:hypothetical protein
MIYLNRTKTTNLVEKTRESLESVKNRLGLKGLKRQNRWKLQRL